METKSRIQWLQIGDRNTRFFHFKSKQRRSYNRILHLTDDAGVEHTKAKDILSQVRSYFQLLYARKAAVFL